MVLLKAETDVVHLYFMLSPYYKPRQGLNQLPSAFVRRFLACPTFCQRPLSILKHNDLNCLGQNSCSQMSSGQCDNCWNLANYLLKQIACLLWFHLNWHINHGFNDQNLSITCITEEGDRHISGCCRSFRGSCQTQVELEALCQPFINGSEVQWQRLCNYYGLFQEDRAEALERRQRLPLSLMRVSQRWSPFCYHFQICSTVPGRSRSSASGFPLYW